MTMSPTCTQCGAPLLDNAAYCGSCGEPADWRDRLSLQGNELRIAPMGKRVLAFGIDLAVVYGIQTTLRVAALVVRFPIRPDNGYLEDYRTCLRQATTTDARADCAYDLWPHLWVALILGFLIPFAIGMTYWTVCNVRGTSIGKYAAGIRIVNARGGRPGLGRGLGRTLAALFLSTPLLWLGYWWAFWQRHHRSWHDMIAGTYVVRVPPARAQPLSADPAAGTPASPVT